MQAFGVLDRYIGKTIFNTIMMTLFMLVSLSGIIKFVDQLKKAGQGSNWPSSGSGRSQRHRPDEYAHPLEDRYRARARRTTLAIYAGGGGVHDGADGCPA